MNSAALIQRMRPTSDALRALTRALSHDDARWRPDGGGWSILEIVENAVPPVLGRILRGVIDLLMAAVSVFMVVFGANLVDTTLFQSYPEFEYVRVGVVYTAIPIGGLITLLFVIEKALVAPESRGTVELPGAGAAGGDVTGRAL